MLILSSLKDAIRRARASSAKAALLRSISEAEGQKVLGEWGLSMSDPDRFYAACYVYFRRIAPNFLREHRSYFEQQGRGFGEEAFHVMWWLLFQRYRPERFLEIGVFRGQTLSLAAMLQRELLLPISVTGISPFLPAGDSVSVYQTGIDYYSDTLAHFARWSLPPPRLIRAYSTDQAAQEEITNGPWDIIYIDGNHDYAVAKADWESAAKGIVKGGVVVLDDSSLYTPFAPPRFASKGHPGPSQVAAEVPRDQFEEILRVGHNRAFERRA